MNSLKKRIMRRVYAIWLVKKSLPVFIIELPLLILFIAKIREMVFWAKVLENARNASINLPSFAEFAASTITTRLPVDLVLIALSFVAIFMIRDLFITSKGILLLLNNDKN